MSGAATIPSRPLQPMAAVPAKPDPGAVRQSVRRTIAVEAAALTALAGQAGDDLYTVASLLLARSGRVVVTGMGKSGHVARKIAATLASTGTPALFLHPAEANHGDLGMIAPDDTVIMLSKSGTSAELAGTLQYCRRFRVPVVAITAEPGSELAQAAAACVILPDQPEACSLGVAPTTSTTMMMAVGDALAVVLYEARGFTREAFGVFHPGGSLGQRLLAVGDIMIPRDRAPILTPGQLMSDAVMRMTEAGLGLVLVEDAGTGDLGIITDGDLRRHMAPDLLSRTVAAVMTRDPVSIGPDRLAIDALMTMSERKVTALVVAEAGRLVGLIRMHDCLSRGVR